MKVKRRTSLVEVLKRPSRRRNRAAVAGVTTGSTPDATTSTKGKLKLAGDLGGTADSPAVESVSSIAKVAGLVAELSFKEPLGSLLFFYSTDVANSDPGSGKVKFNTTTLASMATCRISETDAYGQAVVSIFDQWDNSTDPNRALVVMRKVGSNTVFRAFYLTGAYSDQGSWGNFAVSNAGGTGSFSNGDVVALDVLFGVSLPGHGPSHKSGGPDEIKLNELGNPTGTVNLSGQRLSNMPAAVTTGQAVEYDQMNTGLNYARLGFKVKSSAYAASVRPLPGYSKSGGVLTATSNGYLSEAFGDWQYDFDIGPSFSPQGEIWDIKFDSSGNCYVLLPNLGLVYRFDSSLTYTGQYGSGPGTAAGYLDNPSAIQVDGTYMYIADGNSFSIAGRIQKFNKSTGAYVSTIHAGSSNLYNIGGFCFDPSGNLYVAGEFKIPGGGGISGVLKENSAGVLQWSKFGANGSGNGEFGGLPQGITWWDASPATKCVAVSDTANNRVQILIDANGSYIGKFGTQGVGDGQFICPTGIMVDPSTGFHMYVSDYFNNRVQKWSTSLLTGLTFEYSWGAAGTGKGKFLGPRGIAIDSASRIWVADSLNKRAQRFVPYDLPTGATGGVLVRRQGGGTHVDNGLYEVTNAGGPSTPWVLTCRADNATGVLENGDLVICQKEGSTESRVFFIDTQNPITVGTTPQTWRRFEPGGPPSDHSLNHQPGSIDALATASAEGITGVNREGTSSFFARADHDHEMNTPGVRVYRSTNQSIGNASWTAVSFSHERFDPQDMWVSGSPTLITIPLTGVYMLTGSVKFAANATGTRYAYIENTTGPLNLAGLDMPATSTWVLNLSTVAKLTAGDQVRLIVYQNSGGSLNIESGAPFSEFAVQYLSAG